MSEIDDNYFGDYGEEDDVRSYRNPHELGEGIKRSFRDTLSESGSSVNISSEEGIRKYKHQINKNALREFFDLDVNINRRPDIVKEVNKVILIVVIKHYSHGYEAYEEDFKQIAWDVLMKRRNEPDPEKRYNPSMCPYNYMYTLFRNEIGNKLRKYTREQITDIGALLRDATNPETKAEFPAEIERYLDNLVTGDFTIIRIPKKDVLPLLLFLSKYDKSRGKVPDFIDKSYNPIMYNLLKKLLDE